jgi:hypothetical protein
MAQTTQAVDAKLSLQVTSEQGQKQIQATLTNQGKPVEGATFEFSVARTFGKLPIGKDQTLEDGTAATAFPADLPGNAAGELDVIAVVQTPLEYAGTTTHAVVPGATVIPPQEDFPRALWAPRAPLPLIGVFAVILAAVWCAYAYVVKQIWAIARGK